MLHSVLASHSQNGNSVTGCSVGLTGSALLSREALRYTPRMRATLALVSAIVAMAQTMTPAPRDLEGVWGFATLTPLERPAEFSAPFTSAAEAAAWAKQTIERGARDRRDGGPAAAGPPGGDGERLLVPARHPARIAPRSIADVDDRGPAGRPLAAADGRRARAYRGACRRRARASGGRAGESVAAGTLSRVQRRTADPARTVQQLRQDPAVPRSRRHLHRDDPRRARRAARRPAARAAGGAAVAGRLAR